MDVAKLGRYLTQPLPKVAKDVNRYIRQLEVIEFALPQLVQKFGIQCAIERLEL